MIRNERQYRITKAEAEKFQKTLSNWSPQPAAGVDPIIHNAEKAALESQLGELQRDIEEYEDLQSGRKPVLEVSSFEAFPGVLVKARIALGLSQKDLADRLGVKEQQVQRYEATDYSAASFTRMMEVVNALGINVRNDVFLPTTPATRSTLLGHLKDMGFDHKFVQKRLVPQRLREQPSTTGAEADGFVFHATTFASRILNILPSALLEPVSFGETKMTVPTPRFKVPARVNKDRLNAYVLYAHYLALLMLQATSHLPQKPIPTDAKEVRHAILEKYGGIDLASTLRFIWSHGVPVLPLNDAGAFYGACWRVDGRNVIVLKRRTNLFARWLHLALHELRHAGEEPESSELTVLEEDNTSDGSQYTSEEKQANRFAADVLLDCRAEDLAQQCVEESRPKGRSGRSGMVNRLKTIVPQVAIRAEVSAEALAEYLAYRLSYQGINWWGAATNLQDQSGNPWVTCRDVALEMIDFSRLNPTDRDLLSMALTDMEEE